MELSIIIVNYNVKFFLEQCLYAVQKAIVPITAEVIVVDNHSADQSIAYLKPLFPWVRFIENKENIGFGPANNQALKLCTGDYILFLNPDTIVPEDCFTQCLHFIQSKPGAGALGIRMLDGAGKFLPESKRAFPSPVAAFYKLVGLSALFPASARFNQYSLGHLDPLQDHPVDVLAGAFMLVSKKILAITGGFDERFFMYAEDIDLSYRIQQAGYNNYYFSGCSIIHFKGESTRKGSLNYVLLFYNAMRVFVQKNYRGNKASLFSFFIQVAILIRGAVSLIDKLFIYPIQKNLGRLFFKRVKEEIFAVVADDAAYQEIVHFYSAAGIKMPKMRHFLPENISVRELKTAVTTIIFCASDHYSWKQILEQVQKLSPMNIPFRFHASISNSVIGSDSKETSGQVFSVTPEASSKHW